MIPKALGRDASANDVERLRQRLSMEGDLPQDGGSGDGWDDALTDAVTRFQRRAGLQQSGEVDEATLRELIERHVVRVVVKPQTLEICLIPTSEAQAENPSLADSAPDLRPAAMIALPWTAPSFAADIRLGRIASLAGIAQREAVGERHIRLLAPLALLSPRIIAAIADGTAPADLTVTGLAKALPYSWVE
jgi:hypothetical protein